MWKKENSELCVVAYVSMRHKLQLAKCIISALNDYIDAHCTCYMESRCVVLDNSSDSVITNTGSGRAQVEKWISGIKKYVARHIMKYII